MYNLMFGPLQPFTLQPRESNVHQDDNPDYCICEQYLA